MQFCFRHKPPPFFCHFSKADCACSHSFRAFSSFSAYPKVITFLISIKPPLIHRLHLRRYVCSVDAVELMEIICQCALVCFIFQFGINDFFTGNAAVFNCFRRCNCCSIAKCTNLWTQVFFLFINAIVARHLFLDFLTIIFRPADCRF